MINDRPTKLDGWLMHFLADPSCRSQMVADKLRRCRGYPNGVEVRLETGERRERFPGPVHHTGKLHMLKLPFISI